MSSAHSKTLDESRPGSSIISRESMSMTPISSLKSTFARMAARMLLLLTLLFVTGSAQAQFVFTNFFGTMTNQFKFMSANYTTVEGAGFVDVSVAYILDPQLSVNNGNFSGITNFIFASARVSTTNGTAVAPADYTQTDTFINVSAATPYAIVRIPIGDNTAVGPASKQFTVKLSDAQDFFSFGDSNLLITNIVATIGGTATVTIIDDESTVPDIAGEFSLSHSLYVGTTRESKDDEPGNIGGVKITVLRHRGSTGRMQVDFSTFDGSGIAGQDYVPVSGTLVFDDFQMSESFVVPIVPQTGFKSVYVGCIENARVQDYSAVFGVRITNPRPYSDPTLADPAVTAELSSLIPSPGRINESLVLIHGTTRGINISKSRYYFSEAQNVVDVRRESYNGPEADQDFARIFVHRDRAQDGTLPSLTYEYYILPRDVLVLGVGEDMKGNDFDRASGFAFGRGRNFIFSSSAIETHLSPGSDYATPFTDFIPPSNSSEWVRRTALDFGLINWGQNDADDKTILIPILNDSKVEFNEDLIVFLRDPREPDGDCYGDNTLATVTIMHDNLLGVRNGPLQGKRLNNGFVEGGEQSAGSVDRSFNPDNDRFTEPAFNLTPGANNTVFSVAAQPDGKVVIGGDFTAVNTVPRNRIARMNADGSTDQTFNPGTGANSSVNAVALQPDGSVIMAGRFTSVNGRLSQGIARLHPNGTLDASFKPGIGVNGLVNSIAVQNDGKILIAGEFTTYNGKPVKNLARLNTDGTLDSSFDPGESTDGPIYSIAVNSGAIQASEVARGSFEEERFVYDTGSNIGSITVNYDFFPIPDDLRIYQGEQLIFDTGLVSGAGTVVTNYDGSVSGNSSGVITLVINEGNNLDQDTRWIMDVNIVPQGDTTIVIGGDFTTYQGVDRSSIARVLTSGSLDTTFSPGSGADGVVFSVAKLGGSVFMGGSFNQVDLKPRSKVARLNSDGSLNLQFDPGDGFDNTVYAVNVQPDGRLLAGGLFTTFNQTRRVGMARMNRDGSLDTSFMDTAYNQFAGLPSPYAKDNPISQENFVRSMVYLRTETDIVVTNIVKIGPKGGAITGESNAPVNSKIVGEYVYIGGRFTEVGGGFTRDDKRKRNNIARVIGGSTTGPGNISLLQETYTVDEDGQFVFIKVQRENGALGAAAATFFTEDLPSGPGAASAGSDYRSRTGLVDYPTVYPDARMRSDSLQGPSHNEFFISENNEPRLWNQQRVNYGGNDLYIAVTDDNFSEGDETLRLRLTAPTSTLTLGEERIPLGLALGRRAATLTIVDNDFEFGTLGFGSPQYTVNEDGKFATIDVTRIGGVSGSISVDYLTVDGTAVSTGGIDADYTKTTGTITFGPGQLTNTFRVRINDDVKVEFDESISLVLTNPVGFPANVPVAKRLDPNRASATLTIFDNDFAAGRISFTADTYKVAEPDGFVDVLVRRTGGSLGDVFVTLTTLDGSAKAGVNYEGVTNELHWASGDTKPKTIRIGITNDAVFNADRTFQVVLGSPVVNSVANTNALGARFTGTVVIGNDDQTGSFWFSQSRYEVDENGGYAEIQVVRTGGVAGPYTVNYSATNGAFVGTNVDFIATSGKLNFAAGEIGKSFRVPIIDNNHEDGERSITLRLSGSGTNTITTPVSLEIIDDERQNLAAGSRDTSFSATGADDFIYALGLQPDGKILIGGDFGFVNDVNLKRFARLEAGGAIDNLFDPATGPDATIRDLAVQADGRVLIAGSFTSYNGTNRQHFARVTKNAAADLTFDPGGAADNPAYSVRVLSDGKSLVTGAFASYDGRTFNGVARVNADGTPDLTFKVGTGANAPIYASAVQQDGKILLGGDFTTFAGMTNYQRLARLNVDGTLDTNFAGGSFSLDASVRTLVVQADGKILLGGLFTNAFIPEISGMVVQHPYRSLARLDQFGYADTEFNKMFTGGVDGPVLSIALQIDGKILIGGDFQKFASANHNRLVRLTSDGAIDPTINFGLGPNATVSRIIVQPDRRILIAGGFTEYDGKPANRLARLYGGAISGGGRLEFSAPEYLATESGKKALVTVRRSGGLKGAASGVVSDRRYLPQPQPCEICATRGTGDDADYRPVNALVSFSEGESYATATVDIVDDNAIELDEKLRLQLGSLSANVSFGSQSTAVLTIHSDDSTIGFERSEYSVNENFPTGFAAISLKREGALDFAATVRFYTTNIVITNYVGTNISGTNFTTTNLVANPATGSGTNLDYVGTNIVIRFEPGQATAFAFVQVFDDVIPEPNERALLRLTNAVSELPGGGSVQISATNSLLIIVDDDFATGQIAFSDVAYNVHENDGQAVVTLIRTNGFTGVISVDYATSPGTAVPVRHYTDVHGVVAFTDGETIKSFSIPVVDDKLAENDRTVILTLSNPRGGATILGLTTNTLTIIDDDARQGSLDKTFNPAPNNSPTNIVGVSTNGVVRVVRLLPDGMFVIGGEFTNYNAVPRPRVARLKSDGSLDTAFTFSPYDGPNGIVADILPRGPGQGYFVSGGFNTVNGRVKNRVALLTADGGLDGAFDLPLGLNAEVSSIGAVLGAPAPGLYIGGQFDKASAANRNHIGRLNDTGRLDLSFNPGTGADGDVRRVLPLPDGSVLIVGAFQKVAGFQRGRIARISASGAVLPDFGTDGINNLTAANGDINDVVILRPSGDFLVTGDFTAFNGEPASRIARINATNFTLVKGFGGLTNGLDGVGNVLALDRSKVYVGGDFQQAGGTNRVRLARFNLDDGTVDTSFDPGLGPDKAVYSLVVQPDGNIVIGGAFGKVSGETRSGVARLVGAFRAPEVVQIDPSKVVKTGSPATTLVIPFGSVAGITYELQSSDKIVGGTWTTVDTVTASGGAAQFSQPITGSAAFYRIRVKP